MFKLGKKGTEEKTVGLLYELIAIAAVIIIVLVVFAVLNEKAEDSTEDSLCRTSVIVRSKASLAIVDNLVEFEKITPLACHTTDLGKLKGEREEVKEDIAKYSAKCWWMFAEGSVSDIFKTDKKENSCFVCYTFMIDDKLDEGLPSRVQIFEEPKPEKRENISSYEMTNFLVSETYSPGLIYGGGTKSYYGGDYTYIGSVGIGEEPRIVNPSKIKSTLISGYLMDYSYMMSEQTKEEINKIGAEMQLNNAGNLLVIVAENFRSMKNSDAREIIENTKLNSNDTNYDGTLFLLDLKAQKIMVYMGSDNSVFVKEYELKDLLEESFDDIDSTCKGDAKCNLEEINKALVSAVTAVSDKLLNKQNAVLGISSKSYYYYLTNGGYTLTMISDIVPMQSYAITYVSPSDETGWKVLTPVLVGVGAVGGIVGGVALTITGVGAPGGVPLLISSVGILGGAGAGAGYVGGKLINAPEQKIHPNNIMIVPVTSISDSCTILE